MPIQMLMPALSPTMTEGKLAKWAKKEGDKVSSGDVIAEIETDKATMEVEAVDEGTLGKILVPEGTEGVAVNAPIALLLEEGEDASALQGADGGTPPARSAEGARAGETRGACSDERCGRRRGRLERPLSRPGLPPRRRRAQSGWRQSHLREPAGEAPGEGGGPRPDRRSPAPVRTAASSRPTSRRPRRRRSRGSRRPRRPRPRRLRRRNPLPTPEVGPPYVEVPNSTMRKVIAKRLVQSKREAPHFYLTIDCDIDALMEMRAQLNAARRRARAPSRSRSTTSSSAPWRWRSGPIRMPTARGPTRRSATTRRSTSRSPSPRRTA